LNVPYAQGVNLLVIDTAPLSHEDAIIAAPYPARTIRELLLAKHDKPWRDMAYL